MILNPPAPPKEVELGRRYLIRLNEDGSGTLVERDGKTTYPLQMMSSAQIETFAYELDRELGATR